MAQARSGGRWIDLIGRRWWIAAGLTVLFLFGL